MRIVGIIAAISAFLATFNVAQASTDTINANINTEIVNEKQSNSALDPFLLAFTFNTGEQVQVQKTPEEIHYEQTLEKWKLKQLTLWNNLPKESFVINASAYTAAADECGKSDGITASGVKVHENRTLACPANFPFGTKIQIDGMGVYTCEDRGGAIKGNHIDIYMQTKKEAFQFGRRHLLAQVIQ